MRASTLLAAVLEDALALVLPVHCAGCGAADRVLCTRCGALLAGPARARDLAGGLRVWSSADCTGPVARAIAAYKDAGATGAGRALAAALRRALAAAVADLPAGAEAPLIVPVPSSAAATRRRGYRPVECLLRSARLPCTRALRHVRAVRDQTELGAGERRANLAGSLAADRRLAGRAVLLVDDVVTTGSTLGEAARAARAVGARVLAAATVASTPGPGPPVGSAPSGPPKWGGDIGGRRD